MKNAAHGFPFYTARMDGEKWHLVSVGVYVCEFMYVGKKTESITSSKKRNEQKREIYGIFFWLLKMESVYIYTASNNKKKKKDEAGVRDRDKY